MSVGENETTKRETTMKASSVKVWWVYSQQVDDAVFGNHWFLVAGCESEEKACTVARKLVMAGLRAKIEVQE
jgi:hypothetical protein